MIAAASLERALAYSGGSHTEADIAAAVDRGELQRWDGEASTIITEIKVTPRQKGILFFLAEGNLRELEAMTPPILAWATSLGCTKAQLFGRFGWQRTWLARDGWKAIATVMEKSL